MTETYGWPRKGPRGIAKFLVPVGALLGFVGGGLYGGFGFWFVDRTGDPGSIVDPRLLSPFMALLAAALGAVVGSISGVASWAVVRASRPRSGAQLYLAAFAGAATITALLSWWLLRHTEPIGLAIATGAGFVGVATAASALATFLYSRRTHTSSTLP